MRWIPDLYPVLLEQRQGVVFEEPRELIVPGSTEELPFEVESAWISGWDFTVVFDDALVGGLEGELEKLYANLAASEGVEAVLHEDREVFHLRVEGLDALEVTERVGEAVERVGID